ncbi:RluA family pseudouridine synthase [Aquibaculum arenosum]|uniref:Pseudouridine synthase n=1 Tax=Aquibaculum arenosum TaxID=3032591 RepID=A0ABT5YJA5_9PROT|nr:RluA family pseudouridine synthase [Fodinicurvata sp. CAU 1616]MDF2095023.1 RluA family pseudouridine synthase [Fodinicurvata sp. CAU 1616]
MIETRVITPEEADQRLDRWFRKSYPQVTHGRLEKLLRTGQVRVDGKRAKGNLRLTAGQEIRIPPLGESAGAPVRSPTRARPSDQEAEALRARVLYRDDWVIAIDKPAGLAVQGGSNTPHHLDGLLDALIFDGKERPRLVHRLDRDTAGVLLLARTTEAARRLGAAFKSDAPCKIYWALVAGLPEKPRGMLNLPLGKLPGPKGEKMSSEAPDAKPATTRWSTVAKRGQSAAWLALRPLTGRTHQLRAHCEAMGHPILGDGKYGRRKAFLTQPELPKQLFLFAREIVLPHPEDGMTLRVQAPLPPHFQTAFAALGFDPDDTAAERAADWLTEKQ